ASPRPWKSRSFGWKPARALIGIGTPLRGPSVRPLVLYRTDIVVASTPEALQTTLWITGGHRSRRDLRHPETTTGALGRPSRDSGGEAVSVGFGLDHHLDGGLDVRVQVHDDLELADGAERALAHHHLGLVDRRTGPGQCLGDVARADRTVQLALGGRIGVDRDAGVLERGQALVGIGQLALGLGLVLGATRLEPGHVGRGGRHGLALRHQEVAAVAWLDADLVAKVAEVDDLLEKDQIHGVSPYSLAARRRAATGAVRTDGGRAAHGGRPGIRCCGCRCTGSGPGSARA